MFFGGCYTLTLLMCFCGVFVLSSLVISYRSIGDGSPQLKPSPIRLKRPLVILSLSYHESPIQDLKELLEPLGVIFIERGIMNYGCKFFNSCRSVVTSNDKLLTGAHDHVDKWKADWFYSRFRDDADWKRADAFLCFHPVSVCAYFVHFNKPIIVWATIRLDNGLRSEAGRLRWIETFKTSIGSNPMNIASANNLYDVEYIRFLTGVNATLLPSFCGYVRTTYNPTKAGFLLYRATRAGDFTRFFMNSWTRVNQLLNLNRPAQLLVLHDLYPRHSFSDLVAHRGIVNLPVQPSMMCVFEQYRMNIPLFFPSLELLVEWHMNKKILTEVNGHYGDITSRSFQPHKSQSHLPHLNQYKKDNVAYWMNFSDWYHFPHIYFYNSFEHLAKLLSNITDDSLRETSDKMKTYNLNLRRELKGKWKNELIRAVGYSRANVSRNASI